MWLKQSLLFYNIFVAVQGSISKDSHSGNSPQALPLTAVNSAPVFSDYWTTFLNISYVDTEQNVWRNEKTDVAR